MEVVILTHGNNVEGLFASTQSAETYVKNKYNRNGFEVVISGLNIFVSFGGTLREIYKVNRKKVIE